MESQQCGFQVSGECAACCRERLFQSLNSLFCHCLNYCNYGTGSSLNYIALFKEIVQSAL